MKRIITLCFLLFATKMTVGQPLMQVLFTNGHASYTSGSSVSLFFDYQTTSNTIAYVPFGGLSTVSIPGYTIDLQAFAPVYELMLTGWSDNCGSRNIYNKHGGLAGDDCNGEPHCGAGCGWSGDDDYQTTSSDLDITFYPPEMNIPFSINTSRYHVDYDVRYTFPQLDKPLSTRGSIRHCADQEVTLYTHLPIITNKTGVRYIWKCDYGSGFVAMDTTADSFFTFQPLDYMPVLNTAQYITSVKFKVEGLNNDGHSGESAISQYEFAPKAPSAQVFAYPSCQQMPTGTIQIRNIVRATPDSKYIIRDSLNNIAGCDPNNIASCIAAGGGPISGFDYEIHNVHYGKYTLLLANSGGDAAALPNSDHGACFTWYNIIIDTIPKITLQVDSSRNLSCYQSGDGRIYARCKKTQGPFTFDISPQAGSLTQNDTAAVFSDLPAGTYYVRVKDFCNYYTACDTILISEPPQLTTNVTVPAPATCFHPYNGEVAISAAGAPFYSYRLVADGLAYDSLLHTVSGSWNLGSLPPAVYSYTVQDASRTGCPLIYGAFTITSPVSLSGTASAIPASCNGAADGQIAAVATGGQAGSYIFHLYQNGVSVTSNTTGLFNGLPSAVYSISIRNQNALCLDSLVINNIQVAQPLPLTVSVIKENVSCSGNNNGSVMATPSGGTPPYSYQWEFLAGSSWTYYAMGGQGNGSSISGLFPTSYRVTVTDAHNCTYTIPAESVIEPNSLTVDSIIKQDITCFGAQGSLHVFAQGGTLPYQYRVSADNGTTFAPYTNDASLYTGAYLVEISDAGGCVITYPQSFAITQPPTPLAAQVNTAYYNGYQVRCNGDLASGSFTATGGNGNAFSGYAFSLDNASFTTNAAFTGLPAGIHNIQVKDGRGCIVTRDFDILQPQPVSILESFNQGTLCHNIAAGVSVGAAQGGVVPYVFAINAGLYGSNDTFRNLYPGSYTLGVKDVNGCTAATGITIGSQYDAITLQQQIIDVSCYGLSDGGFTIAAAGGATGYTYKWLKGGFESDITSVRNIRADSFVVKVTDLAGCTDTFKVTVGQPDTALYQHLFVQAICPGNTGGMVIAHARGGTQPYSYSLNNSTFRADSTFSDLPQGTYSLMVKDANHCSNEDTFRILPLALPDPRFLVTTKEYAKDTLVLVNVSIPEADSVQWTFPARTIVYKVSSDSAWIRYDDTGSYTIAMRAFYQNCTFDVEKNIHVTPENGVPSDPGNDQDILSFIASPNPTSGQIHVFVNLNRSLRYLGLQLMDALGQVLWTNTANDVDHYETDLNVLGNKAAGTYFLVAITEKEYRKITIVKQ